MLRISDELQLPADEAQTQTMVVYGGKGMGKTNFGAVLAEELARCGLRFSWIDPVGVAWGLKHSHDGRGPGVEVLILGGVHGDIPINPQAGAIVADLVVDEDVSVIIDISRHPDGRMWGAGEKIRFVRDYCVRLFERQGEERRPIMQIIDEAGRFVPQQMPKGAIDIAECVGAIEQLVELGRNVGAGVALITQRSARMNKSVSELAELMVAFRTVGPRSIDAIVDWFGEHVPRDQQRDLIEQLRKLDRGTALIVSPGWLDVEGAYAIRAREAFDSSATPVAGKERKPRGRGATVNTGKYVERMAETIETAKANDPAELQKQLRELRGKAANLEGKIALLERVTKRSSETVEVEVEKVVEVPMLTAAEQRALGQISAQLERMRETMQETVERETRPYRAIVEKIGRLQSEFEAQVARATTSGERAKPREPAQQPPGAARSPARPPARPTPAPPIDDNEWPLSLGASKLLTVLAQFPAGRTRKQLGVLTGYKASGSSFRGAIAELRRRGYASVSSDPITATPAGLAAAPTGPLPLGRDLYDYWIRNLPEAARKMLEALYEVWPDGLSRDELGERCGYDPKGSSFRGGIAALRNVDLATPGGVEPIRASDELMQEQAA
jgi:uncharacterized protein